LAASLGKRVAALTKGGGYVVLEIAVAQPKNGVPPLVTAGSGAVDDHPQEPLRLVPGKLGCPRRAVLADRKPALATISSPVVEAIEHRVRDLPTRKEPADLAIVKRLARLERADVAALSPFALKAPKAKLTRDSTRKSRHWHVIGGG
jgi:hypothetical protein